MIEVTVSSLAAHPFLRGMRAEQLAALIPAASTVTFPAGHRLFEAGGNATRCWLLQSGSVHLDLHAPGDGRLVVDTIVMGEILGWSWLLPPYQWSAGAVTAGPVQAIELDGPAVRACCAADRVLGHELTGRLLRVVARRLRATRIRLARAATEAEDRPVR
ncbi:MAG TPA: cyclic nucleotide-binding domain-containing protein [Streptosporangiaceae bacterium]|nr:cyclic nucleotide-binding domain-containing protein [Streptosporangiaceae bacterium]